MVEQELEVKELEEEEEEGGEFQSHMRSGPRLLVVDWVWGRLGIEFNLSCYLVASLVRTFRNQ